MIIRSNNRADNELRPLSMTFGIAPYATGSVLIATGNTQVICAATIEKGVPKWMQQQDVKGGWLTAEYSMLPYSTLTRKARDISRGRMDGRSTEIQRLIGRSLRAVVDLDALGERTLWVDCDVLQADGGTRTAAITGAAVAVELASRSLIKKSELKQSLLKQLVSAVSVGLKNGRTLLDLDYNEDKDADVDLNIVLTADGRLVEIQASGEEATFSSEEFALLVELGKAGATQLLDRTTQILNSL